MLGGDWEFTEERSAEIYRRFFGFDKEGAAIKGIAEKVKVELGEILEHLGTAGNDAAVYGRSLDSFSGQLAGTEGADGLKTAIDGIVSATRAVDKQNKDLEARLTRSSDEMSQLREDLEDLRREAITDSLTGIFNRKLFDTQLREAAEEAKERSENLSLLMIDIDNFKRFNDTYGHPVGDKVLQLLGATLSNCIKGQDTAARYGGEEFGVILPNTGNPGAVAVAETICRKVSEKELKNRSTGQSMGRITVSIGAASLVLGETLSDFVARADAALYLAKDGGRDRVVGEKEVRAAAQAERA